MKWLCMFGVLLAMVVATTSVRAQGLSPGDDAPPFELPGSDGQTQRLADYAGKTVIIAWFPMAFTGG